MRQTYSRSSLQIPRRNSEELAPMIYQGDFGVCLLHLQNSAVSRANVDVIANLAFTTRTEDTFPRQSPLYK
ncbi:hypothetical protein Y032_0004g1710 [Ancylostoma ceylanicum]|uniref:Uncharacterized protein n=1 Tax=Ancylostoma ceylanicum TaxID=53326 RepID=A0A016VTN5_9BILA|nr:hypothetical protein Y032_0004g1710 [Ancylostoma ceylanicum]